MEITVNLLKALRDIVSASDAAPFECGPHFDHFELLDALIIER
jgi:hypothetical protein